MAENSTQLEKRTCSICHKEQLEDNFPDYNLANFRRGQLDGCNLCHENSKNRIFQALYRILSSENLATRIDFSKTDDLDGGDEFKREVEYWQFIEKIQHTTKSIANHYFYQIRGEREDEPDNESVDWKDEFLYTLEVYQRLHYTVQRFDRKHYAVRRFDGERYGKQMERNLKYLIYSVLPRVERRKNSESEPIWTHPWISLNSLWVCYGKDPRYDRTDMRICSCSEDYLRNWDKSDYLSVSENYEKVRVFRDFGRLSLDWSDCYHCGGSCNYCEDEDYDGYEYVGEGDWEGIRRLCAKCNDDDLARFDPFFQ